MSEELHEECGVVAIYHLPGKEPSPLCPTQGPNEVSRLIPRMLLDLQNRGQLSCGMTSYNRNRDRLLNTYKGSGTVPEVFHQNDPPKYAPLMDSLVGSAAIGHVRYAAIDEADPSYAHPFERRHIKKNKWFSFAFNGQLANHRYLKEKLLKSDENSCFARDTDGEILLHRLCGALKNSERDLLKVCQSLTDELDGAYTIVFLNALGELFVARDPRGIKPLCYAFDGSLFACASESVALFNLGFDAKDIKDVAPGEMISVTPTDGVKIQQFATAPRTQFCFFEWVYFANAASVIDGTNVYMARKRLGEELARKEKESAAIPYDDGNTIVVPVPDSSKAAADGMAYALGVPCVEGLMRNRYSGRTFIEGGETRQRKAQTKYTPIPEVLEGKRVFLVDDSIVRSTTMRILLQRIYNIGHAKEIHVRISCPPIMAPCFYGLDMSTYSELFATKFMLEHYGFEAECSVDLTTRWLMTPEIEDEMAKDIGCDSLRFLHAQAIGKAIGIPPFGLCRACFNHEYPTEWGYALADEARKKFIATLPQAEK